MLATISLCVIAALWFSVSSCHLSNYKSGTSC